MEAAGRIPLFLALALFAAANARMLGQTVDHGEHPKQPLEYDYCGSLVPATLPHMYRNVFRTVNSLEKVTKQQEIENDPGKSVQTSLRYELGLSDADFAVFDDSATRFGAKEEAFDKQLAAIREADRARHPDSHGVLSESARLANRALIRNREAALSKEFDDLHARLAPDHARALDEHVVAFYLRGLIVPNSAPRASTPCAMPNP
jgi:hypothetical protein